MLVPAILIASVLAPAAAPTAAETLERAEREFRAGGRARAHPDQARPHFRAALTLYQTLRRQGADNPGLCRCAPSSLRGVTDLD